MCEGIKIIVTGGRDRIDLQDLVCDTLDRLSPEEVYVGDCPTGIDYCVRYFYQEIEDKVRVFEADWDKHGKAAGPIRNREMLKTAGKDAIVIAFPGGRGTENCVKQAKELGMIVLRVEL